MPFFSEAGEHLQAAGQARGSSDADRLVMAGYRLSIVAIIHETSTILSPAFCAAQSCRWSAETKVSGSTARAHAT
jgi:hypothetical protein